MKNEQVKFFVIKFLVLNIINLFAFAIGILADVLLGFLLKDAWMETMLVCLISFLVFLGYTYVSTVSMKESPYTPAQFIVKESAAYMLFMIIPTVSALFYGIGRLGEVPILKFYLPNLLGAHVTGLPILGFILQALLFCLTVTLSHHQNIKRWQIWHTEQERLRIEDEQYAEQLAQEHEREQTEEKTSAEND